jgi:DNA-binding transcriptional regulator YiaG
MATPREMIEALGGIRKTAAVLGVPPSTVQHWNETDQVPTWREDALREAYANREKATAASKAA